MKSKKIRHICLILLLLFVPVAIVVVLVLSSIAHTKSDPSYISSSEVEILRIKSSLGDAESAMRLSRYYEIEAKNETLSWVWKKCAVRNGWDANVLKDATWAQAACYIPAKRLNDLKNKAKNKDSLAILQVMFYYEYSKTATPWDEKEEWYYLGSSEKIPFADELIEVNLNKQRTAINHSK
jgi:hypothetical protein